MEIDKESLQFIFGSTIRALHKRTQLEFEKHNIAISPEQNFILKFLDSNQETIQAELAEKMQVDKSGIMRHIDQLEKKGFVKRVNDINDRRKKYLVLTEAGIQELEKSKMIIQQLGISALKNISDAELIIFKQVLNKLKENAEN
ncbi:MAG: MarR family transcriptional regulator [Spirosomataceae bacterium]